jgi:chromate transporter
VVGVIANLAVFFALHNLFDRSHQLAWGPVDLDVPVLSSWDPITSGITAVALLLIFSRKWSTVRTLGVCAVLGLVSTLVA